MKRVCAFIRIVLSACFLPAEFQKSTVFSHFLFSLTFSMQAVSVFVGITLPKHFTSSVYVMRIHSTIQEVPQWVFTLPFAKIAKGDP